MLVTTEQRNTVIAADTPIHQAQISATPAMFKMLFDSIYTHKELAVVRELLANAWDAHVAAGTQDTPICIHLPTVLEPWFQIDDYGTGLAPETVNYLYMDYGNSDKTHTNELIGGFGLGSKAPYCMTDQFTVTSRWYGTAYTFAAFLTETGAPGCVEAGRHETDAPNGLSVYVPVDSIDSYQYFRFEQALRSMLPYLPTAPEVRGAQFECGRQPDPRWICLEDFDIPGLRRAWCFTSDATIPHCTVVQGIVPYEVPRSTMNEAAREIRQKCMDTTRHLCQRLISDTQFVLETDIGTFTPTVSREQIAMGGNAPAVLEDMLYQLIQHYATYLQDRLANANTWYEWAMLCSLFPSEATAGTAPVPESELSGTALLLEPTLRSYNLERGTVLRRDETRRRRRFVARNTKNQLELNTVEHGLRVFVTNKKRLATNRIGRKIFENELNTRYILFLHGTLAAAQQWLDAYGIPATAEPAPQPPAPARSTRQYGSARYSVHEFQLPGPCSRSESITAEEFAKRLNDEAVMVLSTSPCSTKPCVNALCDLYEAKLISSVPRTVHHVAIPSSHRRVRAALLAEAEEAGAQVLTEPLGSDIFKSPLLTDEERRTIARWAYFGRHYFVSSHALKHSRYMLRQIFSESLHPALRPVEEAITALQTVMPLDIPPVIRRVNTTDLEDQVDTDDPWLTATESLTQALVDAIDALPYEALRTLVANICRRGRLADRLSNYPNSELTQLLGRLVNQLLPTEES